MPSEIVRSLVVPSLAGSVLAMLLVVFRPFTKKVFGYAWHYYIWLAVLVVMLLPVRFRLPQHEGSLAVLPIERQEQQTQTESLPQAQAAPPTVADVLALQNAESQALGWLARLLQNEMSDFLGLLWLAGAGGIFLVYLIGYLRLLEKIRKKSATISCPEIKAYSDKTISVRVCEGLASPFMLGMFRSTLILPKKELSAEQLHNILQHEMTHFKRKDILYKWFAILVKCIHWFNPVIYYVVRQINTECEISCDMAVVGRMDDDEQMGYVRTILSLLSDGPAKAIPLTTGMTGNKKILRRRFETMKKKRTTSRLMSALSGIIAAVLLTTTVFASGTMAGQLGNVISSWADAELKKAKEYGLIGIWYTFDDYQREVTRDEFCKIAEALCLQSGITLYSDGRMEEKLTDVRQIQNPEVVDMYCMGIVPSKTETQFCPNDPVTQEDAAVFLQNLFDYVNLSAFYGEHNSESTDFRFKDHGEISESARDSVYSMYQLAILRGDGSGRFCPKQNLTAEKCVILLTRLYEIIHDCYDNAEDLIYNQLQSTQLQVDNGHYPWRLDPMQTIREYADRNNLEFGEITELTETGASIDAAYTIGGTAYHVELFKPIRQNETGIWIVRRFEARS